MTIQYLKLEIFIPATHFRILQKALQSVDAGHIGNYDSCLSYSPVKGTWAKKMKSVKKKSIKWKSP